MGGAVMDEVRGGTIQGTGREPERGWRAPDRGWPRPAGYPSMMLHLASKSPRRRELLGRLGLEFGVLDLDVPEQREPGEGPADYARRVAREKAGAGPLRVVGVPGAAGRGADPRVTRGGEVDGRGGGGGPGW